MVLFSTNEVFKLLVVTLIAVLSVLFYEFGPLSRGEVFGGLGIVGESGVFAMSFGIHSKIGGMWKRGLW